MIHGDCVRIPVCIYLQQTDDACHRQCITTSLALCCALIEIQPAPASNSDSRDRPLSATRNQLETAPVSVASHPALLLAITYSSRSWPIGSHGQAILTPPVSRSNTHTHSLSLFLSLLLCTNLTTVSLLVVRRTPTSLLKTFVSLGDKRQNSELLIITSSFPLKEFSPFRLPLFYIPSRVSKEYILILPDRDQIHHVGPPFVHGGK